VRVEYVAGRHVRAEVRDQGGAGWGGDLAGSARRPHGLYLLLALAGDYGVTGDGDGRTVWFRIGLGAGDEVGTEDAQAIAGGR
jgi:hypothetical protein